jgi:hypothetical protein
VWSYGFYHLDEDVCREYLDASDPYSLSTLIEISIKSKLYNKNV